MDLEENVKDQLDSESHKSRIIEHDTRRKDYDQQYPPSLAQLDRTRATT